MNKIFVLMVLVQLLPLQVLTLSIRSDIPKPEIIMKGLDGSYFKIYHEFDAFDDYREYDGYREWIHDDFNIKTYSLEPDEQNEDGGIEYEIIFNRKLPTVNNIELKIEYSGFDFSYQPEIPYDFMNTTQPENVIGSYAVYYSDNKRNNEYKTGKFCHIYRPHLTDAENNTEWGEIFIDVEKNTLMVELPKKFMRDAVYPVVIDPTFGYTVVGSNNAQVPVNTLAGSNYSVLISANTSLLVNVRSINAYMKDRNGGSTLTRGFLYHSGNETYIHNSVDILINTTWMWWVMNGMNCNVTIGVSGMSYWLGVITKDATGVTLRYDIDGMSLTHSFSDTVGSYGLPYQFNFDTLNSGVKISIYAVYDVLPIQPVIHFLIYPLFLYIIGGIFLCSVGIAVFVGRRRGKR